MAGGNPPKASSPVTPQTPEFGMPISVNFNAATESAQRAPQEQEQATRPRCLA